MLYPTQFLLTFNPFPQFYSSHLQAMESFKIGFGPETAADNELCGGAAVGDDLFVDELLDFSNGYSETEEQMEEPQEVEMEAAKTTSVFRETPPPENSSGNEDFGSLHESELSFQAEEGLESLEWLSHFVEDSFSDYSLTGKLPAAAPVEEQPCFASPVMTKARTKRNRTGVRVWPVLSDSSTSSSSSSSSTTSFPPSSVAISSNDSFLPAKRQKRKQGDGGAAAQPRRCSHCGVTKTPQWRAGPHGPKTLCNACGVRFKSGRLLPEYRPACSPTFSTELHSNNHRKVLEMRQKKEPVTEATGLPMPVLGLID